MSLSNRSLYLTVGLIVVLLVLAASVYFLSFGNLSGMGTAEYNLLFTVVNLITDVVFASVATINMLEVKKSRNEMVRPHLALEPAYFDYDMKTGDIIGFTCLNLLNAGTVARDVEIDFCSSGKCTMLYAASVGTNDRVQLWNGRFSELGDNVTTKVRYKNMFGKSLEESFTIDIDSIKKAQRKFVPVLNPSNAK